MSTMPTIPSQEELKAQLREGAVAHRAYWLGYDRGVADGAAHAYVAPPPIFGLPPPNAFVQRIREYLAARGLFNPEFMQHEQVRDLLIELRDYLSALS